MSGVGVGALIGALLLGSSVVPLLQNPDFEAGEPGQTPPGWLFPSRGPEAGYHFEVSGDAPQGGGKAGRLWRDATVVPRPGVIGVMSQRLDAVALRGHRIRYTAAVRVVKPGSHIGLWMRVDTADGKPAFFDNMGARPIKAADWTVYTIDGYVAQDAGAMTLGFQVAGDGDALIDSARIEDLGPAVGAPTGEAKAYLDHALDLLEKSHINSAKADWPLLRAEADKEAGEATTPGQTHGAIRTVIARLGERHTFLRPPLPPRAPGATSATGASPPAAAALALPTGRMQGQVAVLSLPQLARDLDDPRDEDGRRYAAAITAFLNTADTGKACWIVDLRGHAGGNMWPGLRGLAPLLGQGSPGAFVTASGRQPWPATPPATRGALRGADAPIAVLLGPRTASSGEMIAISFVGRPATRSFGQPTAGLSTANSSYPLSDGALLAVTSSYVEDRLGHRYDGRMIPDETVALDGAEQAALAWLATQGC